MEQKDQKKKYSDPMDDILDRPIAYNPAFKRITGSTVAALFLSQAWYWSKRHGEDEGWFWKIGTEWEEETGLSRSEQETARKHLKALGLIEEDLRDVPARLYYRVNKAKVYALLGVQFAGIPQTEIAGMSQTGMRKHRKQVRRKPANINKNTETPSEIPSETPLGADAPERGMTNPNSGRRTDAPVKGDPMTGILHFAAQARGRELDNIVQAYPADVQKTLRWMVEIWRWPVAAIPEKPEKGGKGGTYAQWIVELRDINRLIDGYGRRALDACVKPCAQITVSHPAAITWALPGVIGQLAVRAESALPQESQFEQNLRADPEAGKRFAEYRAKRQENSPA